MLHIQLSAEKPLAFEGYDELVRGPLEHADPRSFDLIRELLSGPKDSNPCRFSFILKALSAVTISPLEARIHWKKILEHKRRMEIRLCRVVNVKTAAIDYYDQLGVFPDAEKQPETAVESPLPVEKRAVSFPPGAVLEGPDGLCDSDGNRPVGTIGNPEQRLKEEMLRARRYKHALSAILVAVDPSHPIDGGSSCGTGVDVPTIIERIIRKSIRAVDIPARYPGDRFLLILPNTNKREALALAERLHITIEMRATRIKELSCGVTARLAVGQVGKEDNSAGFLESLEHAAKTGEGRRSSAETRVKVANEKTEETNAVSINKGPKIQTQGAFT